MREQMGLGFQFNVLSSIAASAARFFAGRQAVNIDQPADPQLQLYEFENCPYCRRVREVLTELDLDALISPCPKGGQRFRPELIERGGKEQFPYLVDPSTGTQMYESKAIIAYLRQHYGQSDRRFLAHLLRGLGGSLASVFRYGRGMVAKSSRLADKPLHLWSFEASPFSRLVRERLCELELTYQLHNLGKQSSKRAAFQAQHNRVQLPYLEDPNTGEGLFESAAIIQYLNRTYSL